MNLDSSTDHPLVPTDKPTPPSVTVGVQRGPTRQTCKHPLCTDDAVFMSDYCRRHKPELNIDQSVTSPPTVTSDGPSNRDLQRQLDRLEGKLDAVLAALDTEDTA